MPTKRTTHTPEFKLQAVQVVTGQRLSVAEAARRLGIHEGRLHEWKEAHLRAGPPPSLGLATRPRSRS